MAKEVLINKYFFITFCLFIFLVKGLNANETWKSLSYFNNKGESQIVESNDFFLSPKADFFTQLNLFKSYVEDANSSDSLSCLYPARLIALDPKITAKSLLERCEFLRKFVDSTKKKHLSLALSSEYFGSPSSLFGHTMIVFHDEIEPEEDSIAISFGAVVNERDSVLQYILNGVSGAFRGEFINERLFLKEYEYLLKEQRFIHYFNLDLNEEEMLKLVFHLFELRGAQFNYYFFNKNCAYHIDYILSVATGLPLPNNLVYTLPRDTVRKFEKFFKGSVSSVPTVFDLMEKRKLLKRKVGNELKPFQQQQYKNDLIYYQFHSLGVKERDLFESVRTIDKYKKYNKKYNQRDIDHFKYFSRKITAGYSSREIYDISFRPVLISLDEIQKHSLHESSFRLLETTLDLNKSKDVRFKEVAIFDIELKAGFDRVSKLFSWDFYLGVNRMNQQESFTPQLYFGRGLSFRFSQRLLMGLTLNPDLIYDDKFELGAFANLYGIAYLTDITKLTSEYRKYFYNDRGGDYVSVALSQYISRRLAISFKYENVYDRSEESYGGYFSFYF